MFWRGDEGSGEQFSDAVVLLGKAALGLEG
jgi:hypothetical protein